MGLSMAANRVTEQQGTAAFIEISNICNRQYTYILFGVEVMYCKFHLQETMLPRRVSEADRNLDVVEETGDPPPLRSPIRRCWLSELDGENSNY